MRRFSFPFAVVAVLAATIALAAPDRKVAQFEPLAASGISGEARLNPMNDGTTRIQGQLVGLQPSTDYVAVVSQDATCGGTASLVIAHFTANPAGRAVFNELVTQDISTIGSISVQLASDPTVLACAGVQ
jgi:hypothetical protein